MKSFRDIPDIRVQMDISSSVLTGLWCWKFHNETSYGCSKLNSDRNCGVGNVKMSGVMDIRIFRTEGAMDVRS
jgi:hypothetical protein